MNHHKSNRKFGRVKKVRNGLMKSLALALVMEEKIKTTEPKAKELRPYVEKLVTQGLKGTLAGKRAIIAKIGVKGSDKVMKELSPRYTTRKGGYTRITKLPQRLSDGSPMAVIEFVK